MGDVIGQNNAAVDVPAVQQAVDAGGTVVLHGTFGFSGVSLPGPQGTQVVLVTRSVIVRGDDATVLGGGSAATGGLQAAFLIAAPGAAVTFEKIRFVNPFNAAIRVLESGDLRIADCEVDGLLPSAVSGSNGVVNGGVAVNLVRGPYGVVTIEENRIQIAGAPNESLGGIVSGGTASEMRITGNHITGTTAHGMDLRNVGCPARIDRNVVRTGQVGRGGGRGEYVNALRLLGKGDYLVTHNEFDCGFENAAVVRLGGTTKAVVKQNELIASVPGDKVPGAESAGVQVRGLAQANEIVENRIEGRGRVAISAVPSDFPPDTVGAPVHTVFRGNNHQTFAATVATVGIGPGVEGTRIVGGSGTIIDEGTGTDVDGNYQPPS